MLTVFKHKLLVLKIQHVSNRNEIYSAKHITEKEKPQFAVFSFYFCLIYEHDCMIFIHSRKNIMSFYFSV